MPVTPASVIRTVTRRLMIPAATMRRLGAVLFWWVTGVDVFPQVGTVQDKV
jgi:hypothetical protein